jgi:hypothetical protein
MKKYLKIFIFISFVLILSRCKPIVEETKPPIFPKSNTYNFNASVLDNDTVSSQTKTMLNWWIAAKKISLWRYFIKKNIANTYYILSKCKDSKFNFLANKTWYCEKQIQLDTLNVDITLYGTFNADSSVLWEMYAETNNSDKILLLKGENNRYMTQGNWIFYKQNNQFIKIEWQNLDTYLEENFYYVDKNNSFSGSFCKFKFIKDASSNKNFSNMEISLYNSVLKGKSEIKLNLKTHEGGINSMLSFRDTLWHCWNSSLQNTFCIP